VFTALYGLYLCFVWIWENTATISLYSINWIVFITERKCVYCAVRTVFMCFVWIWEQTAIISLYINWLVFITDECVYCAVRTEYRIPVNYPLNRSTRCDEKSQTILSFQIWRAIIEDFRSLPQNLINLKIKSVSLYFFSKPIEPVLYMCKLSNYVSSSSPPHRFL
jgi:hypothetical protein